ncbi:hypothetical protein CHS0354_007354 [Potamilus streckersoni]|uniref:C2 domain-containing protein n=1 Tax=Potamilus streckersoni TaxID=2493646 RepID=A0AAE0VIS2_9BIVA|nr:hypothetical protein CHS0354_007354 [Potamilus streckersoni]
MDSFKDLKEWLVQKIQHFSTKDPDVQREANCRNFKALTPQGIPEFLIPGSENSSRRTSDCSADDEASNISKRGSFGGRSHTFSPPVTPTDSPTQTKTFMYSRVDMATSSAPVTPKHDRNNIISCTDPCDNADGFTNDDPLSIAAMSLPHLRTKTSYGFTTLSECPNTRRKESLFHSCGDSLLTRKSFKKLTKQNSLSKSEDNVGRQSLSLQLDQLDSRVIRKSSNPCVIVTTEESPENAKDSKFRSLAASNELLLSQKKSHPFKRHRVYNRRRSSLVDKVSGPDSEKENSSENSSLTCSSIDASPDQQRKSLGELHAPPFQGQTQKRHSAPNVPVSDPLDTQDKIRSSSCFTIGKTPRFENVEAPHGELKFSFQYLAASKQLKVCLIRAENLGGESKTDLNMNSFAKLYLMPEKVQKQSGSVVKRTKNPNFNQEFYFQQLTLDELHNMVLRIKLFNKSHNLKMAEFIGEVTMPLDSYDLLQENRIWKDLETKEDREDSGFLELALQFEPREGLLNVTIHQARSLPYHQLTGAPDPYVKVELSQPNRSVSRKQTKTKKNTCFPVFSESFSFTISPKMDDLRYTTLIISVFDYKRLRSDDIIGQIIIGSASTEESLLVHWDDVITNPEKTVTKWHYLTEVE